MEEYWHIVNDKLYSSVREGRHKKSWNGPDQDKYAEELLIIRPNFKPIIWGFGSAVCVFISFRLGKSGRFIRSGNGYQFSRNVNPVETQGTVASKKKELQQGLSLPTDLFLSTLIGCSATLFLTDFDQMKKDMEVIPLVKGKSFICDELCSDFISVYTNSSHKSETLDTSLKTFIMNCQQRQQVENQLRRQMDEIQ